MCADNYVITANFALQRAIVGKMIVTIQLSQLSR